METIMFKFVSALLVITSMQFCLAQDINFSVKLKPAGSFELKSKKLNGYLSIENKNYKSHNIFVKVKKLKTGIKLRDKHMYKRLRHKNFKKIKLVKILSAPLDRNTGQAVISIGGIQKKSVSIIKEREMSSM